jgi:hypothetical protein
MLTDFPLPEALAWSYERLLLHNAVYILGGRTLVGWTSAVCTRGRSTAVAEDLGHLYRPKSTRKTCVRARLKANSYLQDRALTLIRP